MKINLFKPHKAQLDIIKLLENPQFNYIVVSAGRRAGKTELAINAMIKYALENDDSIILYLNPRGNQRQLVWNEFIKKFGEGPFIQKLNKTSNDAHFTNGSIIYFRLGSDPSVESLRGGKANFIILDEYALYKAHAWEYILQPMQATIPNPKALFISSPRGKGDFYIKYNMYRDNKNWISYHAPSSCNPLISLEYLEGVKSQISEKAWKQEYLAEFVDDMGSLFENIKAASEKPIKESSRYYAGIDIGFKHDYTVLTIVNEFNQLIDYIRFNDITMNYKTTAQKCHDMLKKYKFPYCYIETNRFDSVYSYLKDMKTQNINEFITTHKSKTDIIENMMNLFSNNDITIPNDDYLISEFTDYEYQYNPKTRNVTFNALEGSHDDIVMSTALALWAKKTKKSFSW